MISTQDLEAIAAGRVIDSTQAPQIARELIAAREVIRRARVLLGSSSSRNFDAVLSKGATLRALAAYDAAREAE